MYEQQMHCCCLSSIPGNSTSRARLLLDENNKSRGRLTTQRESVIKQKTTAEARPRNNSLNTARSKTPCKFLLIQIHRHMPSRPLFEVKVLFNRNIYSQNQIHMVENICIPIFYILSSTSFPFSFVASSNNVCCRYKEQIMKPDLKFNGVMNIVQSHLCLLTAEKYRQLQAIECKNEGFGHGSPKAAAIS